MSHRWSMCSGPEQRPADAQEATVHGCDAARPRRVPAPRRRSHGDGLLAPRARPRAREPACAARARPSTPW